jgi:hypothetical protein
VVWELASDVVEGQGLAQKFQIPISIETPTSKFHWGWEFELSTANHPKHTNRFNPR